MSKVDSHKIADAMQKGIFLKLQLEEQFEIRQLILDGIINTYKDFENQLKK
jgi:hypothetical protein